MSSSLRPTVCMLSSRDFHLIQVDTVSIMELNAYSLGFGVDRQAFKDILLLCTFKQPDSTVVQRVEFVAFACALVQCSSLGELMGHLVTIFGATPSDFFTAVAALIRCTVQPCRVSTVNG